MFNKTYTLNRSGNNESKKHEITKKLSKREQGKKRRKNILNDFYNKMTKIYPED